MPHITVKAHIDRKNGIIIPAISTLDFEKRYGAVEVLEISQLHDPNATTPDYERIALALEDAQCWLSSTLLTMNALGRELVTPGAKRFICAAARFLLDSLRRREVVKEEWEEVNRDIARFASESARLSRWRGDGAGGGSIRIGHSRRAQYTRETMQPFRDLGDNGEYVNFPLEVLERYQSALPSTQEDNDCSQTIELPY